MVKSSLKIVDMFNDMKYSCTFIYTFYTYNIYKISNEKQRTSDQCLKDSPFQLLWKMLPKLQRWALGLFLCIWDGKFIPANLSLMLVCKTNKYEGHLDNWIMFQAIRKCKWNENYKMDSIF